MTFFRFQAKHYQYRQVQRDKVVLAVVPKDGVDMDLLKRQIQSPLEKLKAMLDGVFVELAIVDEIIPSNSGKSRYILNEFVKK